MVPERETPEEYQLRWIREGKTSRYHKNELDVCEECGGYDGCHKTCECPTCYHESYTIQLIRAS